MASNIKAAFQVFQLSLKIGDFVRDLLQFMLDIIERSLQLVHRGGDVLFFVLHRVDARMIMCMLSLYLSLPDHTTQGFILADGACQRDHLFTQMGDALFTHLQVRQHFARLCLNVVRLLKEPVKPFAVHAPASFLRLHSRDVCVRSASRILSRPHYTRHTTTCQ